MAPVASAIRSVQETLNVLTGKFGMSADSIRRLLDEILVPLWQVNPTATLYQSAISLQSRYGFSFYDSLIVARGPRSRVHPVVQ